VIRGRRLLKLSEVIAQQKLSEDSRKTLRQLANVGHSKGGQRKASIERLWEPALTIEDIRQARRYRTGARVVDEISISVGPDDLWSPGAHLVKRGSTHNVYLDWYVYVGKIPFAFFALFILLLTQAFSVFLWKRRDSVHACFYLSIWLQIIVIVAAMYAHPGIWVKYIWFMFGIATAVMILDEKTRN